MCASTRTTEAEAVAGSEPAGGCRLEVAVGVVVHADGRYLLSQRRKGTDHAGCWEFPGGKLEPGETPEQALQRELSEELGIRVLSCRPLIAIPFDYPGRSVLLHTYCVTAYAGDPHGREGQPLGWFETADLEQLSLPAANRGIVNALRLPSQYLITPEPQDYGDDEAFVERLSGLLDDGHRLVQLRAKKLPPSRLRHLAERVSGLCRDRGAMCMINGSVELAREVGADGVHLSARDLSRWQGAQRPDGLWVAASCHDVRELRLAAALQVDFAVCSPVRSTHSHPGAVPIGWDGFASLCATATFPVYALGGMANDDVTSAQTHGGQGIAAIRGLWDQGGWR